MGRAVVAVLGLAVAAFVAVLVWFAISGAREVTDQAADLTTQAPAAADEAAMRQDVHNLQIVVTTLGVEDPSTRVSVRLVDGTYIVTGGASSQELPASDAVVAAGADVTSGDELCVWVGAEDGTTMHATATSGPSQGGC